MTDDRPYQWVARMSDSLIVFGRTREEVADAMTLIAHGRPARLGTIVSREEWDKQAVGATTSSASASPPAA